MLAFDRLPYIRQTLRSWEQVRWLDEWVFTVSVEPSNVQADVLGYGYAFGAELSLNPNVLGVTRHPHDAMARMFAGGADFAVVAEDDAVVSADVLEYLDWADRTYRNDGSVLAVCTRAKTGGDPRHVERRRWFEPYVWATWSTRWDALSKEWEGDHEHGGYDANIGLRLVNEWDVDCLFPLASRSMHIGRGVGTHTLPDSPESVFDAPDFADDHGTELIMEEIR